MSRPTKTDPHPIPLPVGLRPWLAAFAFGVVTACGGSGTGATAAQAALQSDDVPQGMQRCDVSGNMDGFLAAIQTSDQVSYRINKEDWDASKKDGAVAAKVVLYSDSTADCAGVLNTPSGQIGSPSAPLVVNVVVQFQNATAAAAAFKGESIWGLSASQLTSGGATGVVQGTSSGLTANSVVFSGALMGQPFYFAIWQNKVFFTTLAVVNLDVGKSNKIAIHENGRMDKLETSSVTSISSPQTSATGPVSVTGAVGQPLALRYATVTVVGANLNAQPPGSHPGPEPGNRLVEVDVEITFHRTLESGASWHLSDSTGGTYDEFSAQESMSQMPTAPGSTESGQIWYGVPQAATGLTFQVQLDGDSAMVPLG
jgi:hypothetical protein